MTDITMLYLHLNGHEKRIQELEEAVANLILERNTVQQQFESVAQSVIGLVFLNKLHDERITTLSQQVEALETELSEAISEDENAPALLPPPGLLDCATYVKGRLGYEDLRLASTFGRACAKYGRETGVEPIKMAQPGAHWLTVNAWPKDFLSEVWARNFGSRTV